MKVLVVEDEKKVLNFIRNGLTNCEFVVDAASNIDELFSNLLSVSYDAIVLDRLLKGTDAIRSIPSIKKKSPHTKIIVLTALSDVDERVEGLSVGADDYMSKPFHISELIARLRALVRRDHPNGFESDNTLTYKDVVIKLDSQRVERNGIKLDLTPKEYKLLVLLVKKPNRIFSKSQLINEVWELQYYPESNVVEVAINHLRNKLDKDFDEQILHSKRGTGYWIGDKEL